MRFSRRTLFLGAASAVGATQATSSPGIPPATGRRFSGAALKEIAFPLGGIGTGTVSLGGYGNLRDWEIFNRPNKGSVLPFAFVAARVAGGGLSKPLARVLERRPLPPFTGAHGFPRETAAGLPRFREATFYGAYPFARIYFHDARFPVRVSLEAFNPMIPLDVDSSSLPVAILTYRLTSRADTTLDLSVALSLMNPVGYDGVSKLTGRRAAFFGQNLNEFRTEGPLCGVFMSSGKYGPQSPRYGSMAVCTDCQDVSYRLRWEHGAWWDDFHQWWHEFLSEGRFPGTPSRPSEEGATDYATLACHLRLPPGRTAGVTFVLAWHFPNVEISWSNDPAERGTILRNHYGTRWASAWEAAVHVLRNLAQLRSRSEKYRDALYTSTLPPSVIDAISSQASIIRTNTVMVLEGKQVFAFEGCNDNSGCCPMNCTHVYNYEQSMAHLYPELERSMREIDFLVNMRPDGSMGFRTAVPLRPGGRVPFPAADGQMGCILKLYREWQLCGDDTWLRKLWPEAKRALEYAWVKWDADRDGVMEGEQHNTYDIEFYGPNSMTGTLYLGALRAAALMARHLGEFDTAERYEQLFRRGSSALDRLLWNGEYYIQKIDEKQENAAKYQFGEGCLSDQLLGQWFAEVVGLGKLLPQQHIRTALASIYRHNFRTDFSGFANVQRIYALGEEKGLLLCSWPRGGRPLLPFVYSDEVWTGIEYQVAAHLIYEGMIREGVAIVDAVRDRYDGVRRNPWDEIECGHHYARAMASWSLLLAFSGFEYSAPARMLRFRPRINLKSVHCFFCAGTAWGTYSQERAEGEVLSRVRIEEGSLTIAELRVPYRGTKGRITTSLPAETAVQAGEAVIRFREAARFHTGQELTIRMT